MPLTKNTFSLKLDNLSKIIDVDDSVGRSVPINMNFIDEGYLNKDTGFALFGITEASLCHSLYHYKKKDGTSYILRGNGTKLQCYNYKRLFTADNTTDFLDTKATIGVATVTIATPGVVSFTAHGLVVNDTIQFTTTGALPTGLAVATDYYVITSGFGANSFQIALTQGGAAINTSGSQSGVHTLYKSTNRAHGYINTDTILLGTSNIGILPTGLSKNTTYYVVNSTAYTFQVSLTSGGAAINFTTNGTASLYVYKFTGAWENLTPTYTTGEEFGFYVYNDVLYGCNAVESLFSWDGTQFTDFTSAPKGNVLEVFEDRLFVCGVKAQLQTMYYSNVGIPTTFTGTDIVTPLGTDIIQTLKNYYGTLMVFKTESIWKLTFVYNQVVNLYQVKIELQSNNYGACSRKGVSWVENDIWFFTGREVRAIGFKDNQIGVFGVNQSVISENIKETLKLISVDNFSKTVVFYANRRFYLGIALNTNLVDTVFVCHTLYGNSWTKYTSRDKAKINDMILIDDVVYSTVGSGNYGVIKWNEEEDDVATAINSQVFFKRLEDDQFNRFRFYRYLDLMFKDLQAIVTVTITQEQSGATNDKTKAFYVGNVVEGELNALAEVEAGALLVGDSYGENVKASPFVKSRVSFLSKNQAIIIGLSNNRVGEKFTIAKMALTGFVEPTKQFSSSRIISIN